MTTWGARGVLLLSLLSLGLPAAAAGDSAAVQSARLHFKRGTQLYQVHHYGEAAREFEASFAAKPVGITLFNVAQCYEKLGNVPQALKNYREYLRLTPDATDRAAVDVLIRALEAQLRTASRTQSLAVESTPSGAQLLLDGDARGVTPFSADVPVGGHDLQLTLDGYLPERQHVVVNSDAPVHLALALTPAPPTPAPLVSATPQGDWVAQKGPLPLMQRHRVWTWVTLGVAVLVTGVGAGLGVAEKGTEKKWAATAPTSHEDANNAITTAKIEAGGADACYTLGGLGLGGAVALFFLEGK